MHQKYRPLLLVVVSAMKTDGMLGTVWSENILARGGLRKPGLDGSKCYSCGRVNMSFGNA